MSEAQAKVPVHYFDGMEKLGKPHKHFLWIAAMCYFFDLMDMNLFGMIAQPVQAHFGFTLEQMGTLNSLNFYGMFLGGLFAGWISQKIGRKSTLLLCVAIFSLSSLGNAIFDNFYVFGALRFTTGFGIIGMNIVAMVYIVEMMPSKNRGKYQGLAVASGSISLPLVNFLAAYILPKGPENWRFIFMLGALGILLIPVGMKWLRESPRWLVNRGRLEEAEAVVSECTGYPVDLSAQLVAAQSETKVSVAETLKFLFSKGQIKMTLVLTVMSIGGVTGGMFMMNWMYNLLVQYEGLALAPLLMVGAFAVFGTPVGDFLASFISDRGGRKTPVVIMFSLASLCCLGLGMFPSIAGFGVFNFLRAVCATCSMTIFWTYLAENLPNRYRSSSTGLIMSVSRLLVAVVMPLVPIIYLTWGWGWFGVNAVNAAFYFIPAVVALAFGTRTAKKTLEQIEAEARLTA